MLPFSFPDPDVNPLAAYSTSTNFETAASVLERVNRSRLMVGLLGFGNWNDQPSMHQNSRHCVRIVSVDHGALA